MADRARLDPAPGHPRRLVQAGAGLPDEELRRRRAQHPDPRDQREGAEAGRRRASRPADRAADRHSGDGTRRTGRRRSTRRSGRRSREGVLDTRQEGLRPVRLTGKKAVGTVEGVADDGRLRPGDRRPCRTRAGHGCSTQLGGGDERRSRSPIDKLSAAIKEHNDRVTEIDRLRIHVKDEHPLLHAGDLEPRAAGPALLPRSTTSTCRSRCRGADAATRST